MRNAEELVNWGEMFFLVEDEQIFYFIWRKDFKDEVLRLINLSRLKRIRYKSESTTKNVIKLTDEELSLFLDYETVYQILLEDYNESVSQHFESYFRTRRVSKKLIKLVSKVSKARFVIFELTQGVYEII